MLEKLSNNQPVKELAKTPLLLTLICFLFENCNDLPAKRSDLYKEGLEVLMKKWGAKRKIERDHVYTNLSLQSKQDMLGQIALRGFEQSEYVFQKEDLQRQIECICNLPNSDDSEDMLKAIEYHHGLLVERARNIYSFSHLTFQEYFTAREIDRKKHFEILVQNISNPRWKEVFYLTSEILRRTDRFLQLMKERIDGTLAKHEKLQTFLEWTNQKTNSLQFSYKSVSMRAFYAYIAFCACNLGISHTLDLARELDFSLNRALAINRALDHTRSIDLDLARSIDLNRMITFDINYAITLDIAIEIGDDILQQVLQKLKNQLPKDLDKSSKWWESNGEQWRNKLRQVWIDHRNIGHDWQFTKEQVELLNQYYAANLLLVECMNRSDVSVQVREEIESTLLLPISSIPNIEL